jgi:arylsulfatase A-like enzyme
MPALDRLAQQGITFRNHYIASAMCTPSRAALYSGQPPQINGVFDQMEAGYVPSLPKDRPNMGSMMKKLGYRTAFYGKWEMDFDILPPKPTVNSSDALQPYGFDIYQPDGDKTGAPDQGYKTDVYTAAESVRWLRSNVSEPRQSGQPFFMVVSFVNPHDIMYADANVPGTPQVQKAVVNKCAHRAAEQFVVQQALEHRSFADDTRNAVGPGNTHGADGLPHGLVEGPRLYSGEPPRHVAGVQ